MVDLKSVEGWIKVLRDTRCVYITIDRQTDRQIGKAW